jgi:hypothetical protein
MSGGEMASGLALTRQRSFNNLVPFVSGNAARIDHSLVEFAQ